MATDQDVQKIEDAALTLMSGHSLVVSAILNHISGTALQEILASQPEDHAKREAAYHKISAVKDIDYLIRNFASQAEARNKNRNPA